MALQRGATRSPSATREPAKGVGGAAALAADASRPDAIADRIVDAILAGRLAPGQRLGEQALALVRSLTQDIGARPAGSAADARAFVNAFLSLPENANLVQTDAQKAGLKPVGPFRGGKHDVWEGGFRVPYLVRWPGHVPAGTVCDETISIVDTLASIATITGAALPKASEGAEDSHDVSKAWLGETYDGPLRPDVIVHSADGNFAIRKGGFKWIA